MSFTIESVLGIGIPIIIAIVFYFYDDNKVPISIFILLNIGFAIMVYAGYIDVSVLIISLIFSILLTFLLITTKKE